MFPGLKGKRKAPSWLKPVLQCNPGQRVSRDAALVFANPAVTSETASSTQEAALVPVSPAVDSKAASSSQQRSCSTQLIADRKDAPKLITTNAGRASRPVDPLTDDDRRLLLCEYQADVKSRSAAKSLESSWKTWVFYHQRWFGLSTPVLPLTVDIIIAVVSQLKKQQYASIANIISIAKDKHLEARYPWTEFLTREVKRATRSGNRGRGARKQDDEIDIDAAFALNIGDEPLVPQGPIGFSRALEVGSFHLLREIELSLALASSVSINESSLEETFTLPVSKTDPTALGCTRTWGCVCDGAHATPCAYHAMKEQLELLSHKFPNVPLQELPLFPQVDGSVADKIAVVRSIERVAIRLGEPLKDQSGRNRFGGHSIRIAGARRLARLSIPTPTIMLLARWATMVVLRYIKDAPLKGLTLEYRRRSHPSGYTLREVSNGIGNKARLAIENDTNKYAEHEKMLKDIEKRLDTFDNRLELPRFVKNTKSNIHHRADITDPFEFSHLDRITPCGWKYHAGNSSRLKTLSPFLAPKALCARCIPCEHAAAGAVQSSDSSSSDDGD